MYAAVQATSQLDATAAAAAADDDDDDDDGL